MSGTYNRIVWDVEKDRRIQERFCIEGPSKLAREFGVKSPTVRMRAYFLGIKNPRDQKESRKNNERNLKEVYFRDWGREMAYDLGYIFADGAISQRGGKIKSLNLNCRTEDESIILGLHARVGSSHKIRRYSGRFCKKTGTFTKPNTRVCLCGRIFLEYLAGKGVRVNKSNLDLDFPDVSLEFLGHFCRGYLDGDGFICKDKRTGQVYVGFCGGHKFIKGLRDLLVRELGIKGNKVQVARNWSYISWSCKEDLGKLWKFLYMDSDGLCLERKREVLEAVTTLSC